jgi:phosphatidate cytidylyltransferase
MRFQHLSAFQQRLIVGGIATLLAILAICLSPIPLFKPLFTAIIAGSISIAMWELFKIAEAKGFTPAKKLSIALGCIYAASIAICTQYGNAQVPLAKFLPQVTLFCSLLFCFLYYFIKGDSPFTNLSITIFSLAYLAVPLSCMISIAYFFQGSQMPEGRMWLLYLLLVTKMTDTGGYFIGKKFGHRLFGHRLLAPFISPKKTWEGAIGGLGLSMVTSCLFAITLQAVKPSAFQLALAHSIWLGAMLGIIAQFGDLAESLLKRDAGIKDSNRLPGLGGILDTVDSLVFTAPLMYIFLEIYFPR